MPGVLSFTANIQQTVIRIMTDFDPKNFPASLAALIPLASEAELGPGESNREARETLESFDLAAAFAPHAITDAEMAAACLSGLWLGHNFLDESHTISQEIYNSTGSFWHGIMHRREGDYSNAKHWFRKTGDHEAFDSLAAAARHLAGEIDHDDDAAFLKSQTTWDPMAFVDLCEKAYAGRSTATTLCRRIARCEWELLLSYSFEQATATAERP